MKVQIFKLSTVPMEINKNILSYYRPQVKLPLNFALLFSAMAHSPLKFSS